MLQSTEQDLSDHAEDAALRVEEIVEPAVWIPDFPGDEPDMEYADWRDLLFVYSEVPDGSTPIVSSANVSSDSGNGKGARTDA
jgi:hypothetical protein